MDHVARTVWQIGKGEGKVRRGCGDVKSRGGQGERPHEPDADFTSSLAPRRSLAFVSLLHFFN